MTPQPSIASGRTISAGEILATLEKSGKPQTAAIYKRHGAGDNVFGTLTSEIAKLQKKIKVNHALAMELWQTGYAEARVLALQVADPQQLTRADAERLLHEGQIRFVGCYLATLLGRSPIARDVMDAWMKSSDEYTREMGYGILSVLLKDDPESFDDTEVAKILETIEREMHTSPNWARYAMNGALIAVGVYKPSCRNKALETAKRIGKVTVDHGETNCKTPDAVPYIEKASTSSRCP